MKKGIKEFMEFEVAKQSVILGGTDNPIEKNKTKKPGEDTSDDD